MEPISRQEIPIDLSRVSQTMSTWEKLITQQNLLTADRIESAFMCGAIGDALGLPVEILTPQEIAIQFGRVTTFISNPDHKWYGSAKPGTWSDDTQLTIAVQEALARNGFCIKELKLTHCAAAKESVLGWGHTTKLAVARFENPEYLPGEIAPGSGNGVIMKALPLAVWLRLKIADPAAIPRILDAFTDLTHPTPAARLATHAYVAALLCIANSDLPAFSPHHLVETIISATKTPGSDEPSKTLLSRLGELRDFESLDQAATIERWGQGGCNVINSLPVTLLLFLKHYRTFNAVIEAVNAGGDTDSNASMVGCMLGLLHGNAIVPKDLESQLQQSEQVKIAARISSGQMGCA